MKPIKLPKEEKQTLIDDLQAHLELEHGVTLGQLATEQLVDYMINQLKEPIYNQAIEDACRTVSDRMAVLEEDLYALKVSKRARR
ncbi:DUF2164 domain-containing protein [Paenibacillus oryzisoli]|uniref:DUF2164 domain-containing protein n=1 Tax=Paenibacillus oryzisoli TaxID=1850517 RepID=UPI003D2AF86C